MLGIRRETRYQCERCGNVALCVEPCFEIYHTKIDITSNLYEDEDDDTTTEESESESENEIDN